MSLFVVDAAAQRMPERGLVRKGNRLFAKERYEHSSNAYREALQHDSTSFEARYDLANALIRMAMADTTAYANPEGSAAKMSSGNLQQAEALLQAAAADSLQTAQNRAEAYYNLGNAQFVQQKLQDALQSYRRSLVLNPDDMEAKYNYALTKKLLEQNQQNDQNQQNQDNQNNQNNQDNQNRRISRRVGTIIRIRTTKTTITKTKIRTRIISRVVATRTRIRRIKASNPSSPPRAV